MNMSKPPFKTTRENPDKKSSPPLNSGAEASTPLERKARAFDALIAHKNTSLHIFCRHLQGVNTNKVHSDLQRMGYLYKSKGIYRIYSEYRDILFSEQYSDVDGHQEIVVLEKGKILLINLYKNGDLTMKKNASHQKNNNESP